jgi:hypothetical protein
MNPTTTNPELLFEVRDGITSTEVLNGGVDAVELASQLDQATATAIGVILAEHQSALAPLLATHLAGLLKEKVWAASPDELEDIVQQAKDAGREVWLQVRPAVIERNDYQAAQVRKCTSPDALEMMLASMAKSDSDWLPAAVYAAAKDSLRDMIKMASMVQLDTISDVAKAWRCRRDLLPDIKARDQALVRFASRYEKAFGGYVVKSGPRQELVDKVRRAIRMVENGWEFVD